MVELDSLDIAHEGDALGDAYEYLIGQFASDSGKSWGVLYTTSCFYLNDSNCVKW